MAAKPLLMLVKLLVLVLVLAPLVVVQSVKLTTATKTFGHAVKNGALPPVNATDAETIIFEHTCVTAPCTINQIHVPSIYPKNKADWAWQNGFIRFYIDGESVASVGLKLLELSWVSEWASPAHSSLAPGSSGGQYDNRGLPWGLADFGHTASSGGVSSTIRIPFGKSVRVTIQAPPNTFTTSVYWAIIRGIENSAVTLGELELPPTARLKIHRVNTTLNNGELVTLAAAPAGISGALVGTKFDANGHSDGFLEACMRFYPTGADAAKNSTPIFLSSGAEDYFLSASYFDEGEFISPNSGLTYKQGGAIGSYKMHDLRDQVVFHDGFSMQFRAGETTTGCGTELLCPNQYCQPNASAVPTSIEVEGLLARRHAERNVAMVAKEAAEHTAVAPSCVAGPIAYGFDRPGGGPFDSMKYDGKKCSGVGMINTTGCNAQACAAQCCNNTKCVAYVHGIAPGCDQTEPFDPQAICCWHRIGSSPQIVVKSEDYLATGEVAGHGGAPSPSPHQGGGGGPAPPAPPAPALPAGVFVHYSTLVFTYEWPSADTPKQMHPDAAGDGSLAARLAELSELLAKGTITTVEHDAARQAALGI